MSRDRLSERPNCPACGRVLGRLWELDLEDGDSSSYLCPNYDCETELVVGCQEFSATDESSGAVEEKKFYEVRKYDEP